MKSEIIINGKTIAVTDYRKEIKDYRILRNELSEARPGFIPYIESKFFESQGYSLPVVKIDEETYIFPTVAKVAGKTSTLKDYSNFCIVNLDILLATQNYYYHQAKVVNDKNPPLQRRYSVRIRKRGSNTMSYVQFNLSTFIHGEGKRWIYHRELQEEIKFKANDIKFQTEELENVFAKGEETSYGNEKLNDKLLKEYGVKVKLQNGDIIQKNHIKIIEKSLSKFHQTIGSISSICRDFSLKISYARDKHMHGRSAAGIFDNDFKVVGISEIGNVEQTLAHELGHFMDFYLGDKNYRYYLSDDKSSIAGQIAILFRKNMVIKQSSEYQNRTKECFARAVEQYFCIANNITVDNHKGNYCTTKDFNEHIKPLMLEFKKQLSVTTKL